MGERTVNGIPGVTASMPVITRLTGRVQIIQANKECPYQSANANIKFYARTRRCLLAKKKEFRKDDN